MYFRILDIEGHFNIFSYLQRHVAISSVMTEASENLWLMWLMIQPLISRLIFWYVSLPTETLGYVLQPHDFHEFDQKS